MTTGTMADRAIELPVFVDPTGRRRRLFRSFGTVVAVLAAAYLVLLVAGFIGASWVPSLRLPVLGSVLPQEATHAPPALGARSVQVGGGSRASCSSSLPRT